MPKRRSKHLRAPRPLLATHQHAEDKSDGRWVVQPMTGQHAVKTYRCPACNHDIRPGTPHLVVWPHDPGPGQDSAVALRRHWHTACWNRHR